MTDYNLPAFEQLEHIVRRTLPHAKGLANTVTGIDNFGSIYKAALTAAHNPRAIPNALYVTVYGLMGNIAALTGDAAIAVTIFKIVNDQTTVERISDGVVGLFSFTAAVMAYLLGRALHEEAEKCLLK